jgi:hypothetical protein
MLDQLKQYAVGGRWMNKRHQTSPGSDARRLVNQTRAFFFQFPELRANVINSDRNVMNTRATLLNKLCNG